MITAIRSVDTASDDVALIESSTAVFASLCRQSRRLLADAER
jgi:hypothetical protein